MPYLFTNEDTDMHFTYGFCNGNARAAVVGYWQLTSQNSTWQNISELTLRVNGSSSGLNQNVNKKGHGDDDVLTAVQQSRSKSVCRISMTIGV